MAPCTWVGRGWERARLVHTFSQMVGRKSACASRVSRVGDCGCARSVENCNRVGSRGVSCVCIKTVTTFYTVECVVCRERGSAWCACACVIGRAHLSPFLHSPLRTLETGRRGPGATSLLLPPAPLCTDHSSQGDATAHWHCANTACPTSNDNNVTPNIKQRSSEHTQYSTRRQWGLGTVPPQS